MSMKLTVVELEKLVLSSILFNPDNLSEVHSILKSSDFFFPAHKELFKTFLALEAEELPIDEEFIRQKASTDIISDHALIEILSASPISQPVEYAKLIKEENNKREISQELSRVRASLLDENVSSLKVLQDMEILVEKKKKNIKTRYSPKKYDQIEDKEIEFWLKDWLPIPKNITAMLTAKGGTGKSFSALHIATRIAQEDPKAKVLLWLSEDPLSITKSRMKDVVALSMHNPELVNNIDILGNETIPFHLFSEEKKLSVSEEWFEFKQFADQYDFIVLDPLIAYYGGDENANSQARYFMNILNEFCVLRNKTILLIHHHSKNSDESRGAQAFVDAVRLHYVVSLPEEPEEGSKAGPTDPRMRDFEIKKDNWGVQFFLGDKIVSRQIFLKNFKDSGETMTIKASPSSAQNKYTKNKTIETPKITNFEASQKFVKKVRRH